jgi:DNA polymerase III delta subunit
MVAFDLSGEKPWERLSRLKRWVMREVQRRGKRLSVAVIGQLSELCTLDFATLMQEMEKAILYVGDAPEIDERAIEKITTLKVYQNGWQLSEKIVWGGEVHFPSLSKLDSQDLYPFIGQLRYQIQLGLIVSSALERGDEKGIEKQYPKMPTKSVEKYKQQAKSRSVSYFREGLKYLFDLELKLKKCGGKRLFFLDEFIAKLRGAMR